MACIVYAGKRQLRLSKNVGKLELSWAHRNGQRTMSGQDNGGFSTEFRQGKWLGKQNMEKVLTELYNKGSYGIQKIIESSQEKI